MTNKIAYLHGSPRKNSKTYAISRFAIQAARAQGAEVTEIYLAQLKFDIPGCSGCMKCHQSKDFLCIIGDQTAKTVATLCDYDVIVVATPTYWMSFPAQVKMFIDRMGSLMKFSETGEIRTPLAGKVLSLLATASSGLENNLNLLEQQWRNIGHMLSCSFSSCLFPNAPEEVGALISDPSALKKAKEFGRQLAS